MRRTPTGVGTDETVITRPMALAAVVAVLVAPGVGAQVRSVTLDEAVAMALDVSPQMTQARGQISSVGASRLDAWGNWLPSLTMSSSWSQNSATRFDERTQTNISTTSAGSYSTSLSASYDLFSGFRRFGQHRLVGADAASADAAYVNQEFQTILTTKQSFFNALAAIELVRVSDTRIERAEEQLRISRDKLANGTAIRSDTLRSVVEVGNAQLQRINAITQQATAEAQLARLIGVEGSVTPDADSGLLRPIDLDTTSLRRVIMYDAPSVVQAEAQVHSAEASLSVSRAQYFPSLSTSYSRSFSGQAIDALAGSWSLRFNLSWPLFNGFSREAQVSRSSIAVDNALASADDARRQANALLTQYFASLASARVRFTIAEASYLAAEEDLRIQRERYRLGGATIVDVLLVQQNLDQAAVDRIQAALDYLVAKAQIEALVGREL